MKHEQIGSRCLPPCREAYENWYGEDEELLESENHFSTNRDETFKELLLELSKDDRVNAEEMGPNNGHPNPFIKIELKPFKNKPKTWRPFMCRIRR